MVLELSQRNRADGRNPDYLGKLVFGLTERVRVDFRKENLILTGEDSQMVNLLLGWWPHPAKTSVNVDALPQIIDFVEGQSSMLALAVG